MAPASGSDYHALGQKFHSEDPDIRFMTLVDLGRLLDNTAGTTLARENAICTMIVDNLIRLLDDTNGDVQNQALKCIKPFTAKAPPEILVSFMQKVVNLETSKSQDASITSTAARTLVLSLPYPIQGVPVSRQTLESYHAVSQVLIPKILGKSTNSKSGATVKGFIDFGSQKGVSIESLDLLYEVIRCYGLLFTTSELKTIKDCLMKVLDDKNTGPIAKKRAIASVSKLSTWMTDDDLSVFISEVIEDFRQPHITTQKRRLLILVLGAIARSISTKFGPYLQTIAPFVLSAVSDQELQETLEAIAEDTHDAAVDDLKEAAFLTTEDFLICCPSEMREFTGDVIEAGLRYLSYNPTMVNESDDEMAEEEEEEMFAEDDEYEQEEQFDDEDDTSWKIRRCAGRVFNALISSRPDIIEEGQLYNRILPALTKAFKDREESVQLEALLATTLIIKKTADSTPLQIIPARGNLQDNQSVKQSRKRRRVDSTAGISNGDDFSRGYMSPTDGLSSPTTGPVNELMLQSSQIISNIINLLSHKSTSSRQAAISLLKAFVQLKHDSLAKQLDKIFRPVLDIVLIPNSTSMPHTYTSTALGGTVTGGTLRIEALYLLGVLFDSHSSTSTSPFVSEVIKAIALTIDDRNIKVATASLEAAESVIKALTPPRTFGYDQKSKTYMEEMFDIVLKKADSNDSDLEVRQKAIQALGVCVARTVNAPGNLSGGRSAHALIFLREKLAGETTKIPATLAIDLILSSNDLGQIDRDWVNSIATELGNHLRKADRRIRAIGLAAIKKLTGNVTTKTSLDHEVVRALASLVLQVQNTEGLTYAVLVTEILSDLISISPQAVVTDTFNQTICQMVVQNLGGHTLDSFLELVANVGSAGVGAPLMEDLLKKVGVQGDPQIVGVTIGTLLAFGKSTIPVKVENFVSEVNSKADDRRVALALIILGEIGSILGSDSKITPEIFATSLNSKSELVQASAATSLGRAGAANTAVFMPVLFKTFQSDSSNRSLGLLSIKELLQQTSKANASLTSHIQKLWDTLFDVALVDETRALTAECIGRLVALEPAKYFPLLQDYLNHTRPGIRGAVIQAVRFAVSDTDEASDEILRPYLTKMLLVMLQDNDIENRRLAMTTLHSAARTKPRLVLSNLPQLLPHVIKASELDPRLIREVQMGPFKHKVDDGLELRKGAYETLHAFIDLAYSRMNHVELFNRVVAGLQDDHDVKMISFLMLTKLMAIDHDEIGRRLDIIAERFQAILNTKLKDNAVKQEVEKLKDIVQEVVNVTVRLTQEYPEFVSANSANSSAGATFRSYLDAVRRDYAAQLQAADTDIRREH